MNHSVQVIANALERCRDFGLLSLPDCSAYTDVGIAVQPQVPEVGFPAEPRLRDLTIPMVQSLQVSANLGGEVELFGTWLLHIHRVCELKSGIFESALSLEPGHRAWPELALRLALLFMDWFNRSNDVRFLNTALKILDNTRLVRHVVARDGRPHTAADALGGLASALREYSLSRISAVDWHSPAAPTPEEWFVLSTELPNSVPPTSVVVFSPNRYGVYTLRVLDLLKEHGIAVSSVVVRKMMNTQRIAQEFRRDGKKLVQKVWRKVIHRGSSGSQDAAAPPLHKSIDAWGKAHGVPVISCETLNDTAVEEALRRQSPDLVVFTGGGLIRRHILELSGKGILNCHMGALPAYRGFNTVDWMVLNNDLKRMALTVHFMAEALDEGDVLGVYPVDASGVESVQALRTKMEAEMPQAMVHALTAYRAGSLSRKPQQRKDGKQYFAMHPLLREITEGRMR